MVRIGVGGYGNIGQQHCHLIQARAKHEPLKSRLGDISLTAVCASTDPGLRQVQWFEQLHDMLQADCVDAVLIATPTHTHVELTQLCLDAGVHVLVEKPLAPSVAQAQQLLESVADDQQLAVMLNQRFHPAYRAIKAVLEEGRLGRLQRFSWIMTAWYRPNVYYEVSPWRGTWAGEGGGLLLNQCIHNLDVLHWWFGLPQGVVSRVRFGDRHIGTIEVDDEVTAMFDFAGAFDGILVASSAEAPGSNQLEIVGDQGTLRFDGEALRLVTLSPASSEHIADTKDMFGMPEQHESVLAYESQIDQHGEVLAEFVDSIRSGQPGSTSIEQGIGSLQIANAILQSAWEGSRVALPVDAAVYDTELQRRSARGLREPKNIQANIDMSKSYR